MIKKLTGTDLASSKPRSGMSSVGELLPRLIRSYELQAELMRRRSENASDHHSGSHKTTQATFAWYE